MSEFTDAVARGTHGMEGVSSGACPGCMTCAENHGIVLRDESDTPRAQETIAAEFRKLWESGKTNDEAEFSWCPCGVCGSRLGGDRYVWHWVHVIPSGNPNVPIRDLHHESDMCTDCVRFLANGDEPENWKR